MPISKEEVAHIAQLARIELSDAEIKKFQHQLSLIIDYVNKLKEADVEPVKEILSNRGVNVFREDKAERYAKHKELLNQAPEQKNEHFKVEAVLK